MARIRTIKPEFFRHEDLIKAEQTTGLPIRIAFAGLFTVADRAGRFEWKPQVLKLDVLPFDDVDFSKVLNVLAEFGFVRCYRTKNIPENPMADKHARIFGFIPSWKNHQIINNRESESKLPDPEQYCEILEVTQSGIKPPSRVGHATGTPLVHASGEGKGREGEGKGKGMLPNADASATRGVMTPSPEAGKTLGSKVFEAYADEYAKRYGAQPVRDRMANSLCKAIGESLGEEGPDVARFYVHHPKAFYVQSMHPLNLFKQDAAALRTQWVTGQTMTTNKARAQERTQNAFDAFSKHITEEVPE